MRPAKIAASDEPLLIPGVETNVRIVRPGADLVLPVRLARLKGSGLSADNIEKACNKLRFGRGLPAVRPHGKNGNPTLLVATSAPIPTERIAGDDWEVQIFDQGEHTPLSLDRPLDSEWMPQLIERALLNTIRTQTECWTFSSARIWYEKEPFLVRDDIAAFRRFQISALHVEGVGVGLAIDVQTAFFTAQPLAWFLNPGNRDRGFKERERYLHWLMARQDGQHGTLMYDSGRRERSTCYFERAQRGQTCATTGPRRVQKQSFDSLWHYYHAKHPGLAVTPDDIAVWVSFKGITKAQPIAARYAWARVMNENVPDSLRDVDKIEPEERRALVIKFWKSLGPEPLEELSLQLEEDFWRPGESRMWHVPFPVLEFGSGQKLQPPALTSASSAFHRTELLKSHFRARKEALEHAGCYHLPPSAPRVIACPHPQNVTQEAQSLATDVAARLKNWTKKAFSVVPQPYNGIEDGINKTLRRADTDLALFVLNRQQAAYHAVGWHLAEAKWGLKRVTEYNLGRHFRHRAEGIRVRGQYNKEKGQRSWESFVGMTALDVFCQMEGVPFRVEDLGVHEAMLVIDVSHNRRYFGVALLLARDDGVQGFRSYSVIQHKIDHKAEAISAKALEDEIVQLFQACLPQRARPLASLLTIRDGKLCANEQAAVDTAMARLVPLAKVIPGIRNDTVELHKDSLKSLRAWEIMPEGRVVNVEENTAIEYASDLCWLATTGRATLHQGTANPLILRSTGRCSNLRDVANACGAAAQLNWASPAVAQRLPLALEQLDEALINRAAQDIKHRN